MFTFTLHSLKVSVQTIVADCQSYLLQLVNYKAKKSCKINITGESCDLTMLVLLQKLCVLNNNNIIHF